MIGVVATGAGLAVGELLVGAIEGAVSPVVAVGNKVIDLVPLPLKNWAVETFGTSDKVVLVVTTLAILFIAGIAIGTLAVTGRRTSALIGTAVVGLVGVAAVLTRPDPTVAEVVPIVVGTLVSGGVLWWLAPSPTVAVDVAAPPSHAVATVGVTDELSRSNRRPPSSQDRASPIVASSCCAASAWRRWLSSPAAPGGCCNVATTSGSERAALALPSVADQRPAAVLPPNADLDVEGLSAFVTPNADFYRIDTALVVPQVSKDEWRLRIHGMVERELELTFDDLLARDQIEAYVTLACVSNPVGGPYVGNALWQGVRLADILAEVGVDPASTQLLSTSVDGWTCGTPVSSLTDGRNAMLAVAMNGEPLPAEHGYPVRMVVPGEYGYVSATKWVVDMEFTTWEAVDAYWVPRGWSQQAPMKTMTRIEVPDTARPWPSGRSRSPARPMPCTAASRPSRCESTGASGCAPTSAACPSPDTWRKWVDRRSTSTPASTPSRRGPPTDSARCRPTRSPTSPRTAPAATTPSSTSFRRVRRTTPTLLTSGKSRSTQTAAWSEAACTDSVISG